MARALFVSSVGPARRPGAEAPVVADASQPPRCRPPASLARPGGGLVAVEPQLTLLLATCCYRASSPWRNLYSMCASLTLSGRTRVLGSAIRAVLGRPEQLCSDLRSGALFASVSKFSPAATPFGDSGRHNASASA
ncbi:hypothetical protein NL676_017120 [Syzygium grande]|nr:hypothetical protein NL676_017120 [Syzygium grande]